MFLSKKKLANPDCDAGIFPASQLVRFECQSHLLDLFIYTQLPACVCREGGRGREREVPLVLTDSYVQKTYSFHWQQIPSKKPSAVPFNVLVERLNMCYLSQHSDFWREPQFKCSLFFGEGGIKGS